MIRKIAISLTFLAMLSIGLNLIVPSSIAVTKPYTWVIQVVDSAKNVLNGTASGVVKQPSIVVQIADSSNHIIDGFGGGSIATSGTGNPTLTSNSTDPIAAMTLNNQEPNYGANGNPTIDFPWNAASGYSDWMNFETAAGDDHWALESGASGNISLYSYIHNVYLDMSPTDGANLVAGNGTDTSSLHLGPGPEVELRAVPGVSELTISDTQSTLLDPYGYLQINSSMLNLYSHNPDVSNYELLRFDNTSGQVILSTRGNTSLSMAADSDITLLTAGGGAAIRMNSAFLTLGGSLLQLGSNQGAGTLQLNGSNSAWTKFTVGVNLANQVFVMPTNSGAANDHLVSDGGNPANLTFTSEMRIPKSSVGSLGTCDAGHDGVVKIATDALNAGACVVGSAVTAGGITYCGVVCHTNAWVHY